VIYAVDGDSNNKLFVGQQVDVFIDAAPEATHEAKNTISPVGREYRFRLP
jgi:hypothetical protein